MDGVAVPYDEVEWVRTDESVREFIIMEHRPCPKTQEKKYTQTHVRMFTRSEFNLWREALDPKMSNSTLYAHTESKMVCLRRRRGQLSCWTVWPCRTMR